MTPKPDPCPFCGKMPAVEPKRGQYGFAAVVCHNLDCPARPFVDDEVIDDYQGPHRGLDFFKDAAVRRWNEALRKNRKG